jgi:hypothetical protein
MESIAEGVGYYLEGEVRGRGDAIQRGHSGRCALGNHRYPTELQGLGRQNRDLIYDLSGNETSFAL